MYYWDNNHPVHRFFFEIKKLRSNKIFSSITHIVKSPLTGLLGSLELLNQSYENLDETEIKTLLNNAYSSASGIYFMIEDLLLYFKLISNKIELKIDEVNLKIVLDETLKIFEHHFVKGTTKVIFLENDNNFIKFDYTSVLIILKNLFNFSIKFFNRIDRIDIQNKTSARYLTLYFEIAGFPKIEEEEIKKFNSCDYFETNNFEFNNRYFQLILAKRLMDLNGGKLSLKNTKDKYLFSLVFPKFIEK